MGATKRPAYRVVAIEGRKPRDGRSLEILGFYDPLTDPATVKIETDRLRAWICKGARPSDTVVRLLRQVGLDAKGDLSGEIAAPKPRKARAKPAPRAAGGGRAKTTAKTSVKAAAEASSEASEESADSTASAESAPASEAEGEASA